MKKMKLFTYCLFLILFVGIAKYTIGAQPTQGFDYCYETYGSICKDVVIGGKPGNPVDKGCVSSSSMLDKCK